MHVTPMGLLEDLDWITQLWNLTHFLLGLVHGAKNLLVGPGLLDVCHKFQSFLILHMTSLYDVCFQEVIYSSEVSLNPASQDR